MCEGNNVNSVIYEEHYREYPCYQGDDQEEGYVEYPYFEEEDIAAYIVGEFDGKEIRDEDKIKIQS
jgi:hypothetical protein